MKRSFLMLRAESGKDYFLTKMTKYSGIVKPHHKNLNPQSSLLTLGKLKIKISINSVVQKIK